MSALNDIRGIEQSDDLSDAERSKRSSVNDKGNPSEALPKKVDDASVNRQIDLLFRKYHKPLMSFLRNQCGHDDEIAKEVAQETFIALARHIKAGGPLDHERGLIHKIAKTKLVDYHRRSAVRMQSAHDDLDDHRPESKAPSHERVIESEERLALLEQIVLDLPPKCQQVFVLRAFEEMKYDEIAVRCGISQSMVEKHLNKAFKIVREKMQS